MGLPASVPVDGTRRVILCPTVANIAAVTPTEANAGIDITGYLTGDGWIPGGDQATVADSRLRATQDFEKPGRKSRTLAVRYTYNLAEPTDDEARLALLEGTTGVILNVLQKPDLDGDTITADDWYEAWPIQSGEPMVVPSEANAVDRIDQKLFVTGVVETFRKFAAA